MGKASRSRKLAESAANTVVTPNGVGLRIPWFSVSIAALLAIGIATVLVLAQQRESIAGVAPEAFKDHWHTSFSINACGEWLPPTTDTEHGNGIHSHADGVIHIHPANTSAAGPNATLGEFLETAGATLTDDRYLPGRGELPTVLDEAEGCNGEPSQLVLAVWSSEDPTAEAEIVRTGLADYRFETDGQIFTLALVPEGEPVPQSPTASQLDDLAVLD